ESDYIWAPYPDTIISAGGGNDVIYGVNIDGGAGNDELIVAWGHTGRLSGGAGSDTLRGSWRADRLDGGSGNDYLEGRDGDDTFIYTSGNDTIVDFSAVAGNRDVIDLSATRLTTFAAVMATARQVGSDTVFTFGSGKTLTVKNRLLSEFTAEDFGFGTGPTPGPDTLTGTEGNDTLDGGDGDDRIDGGGGDDSI